MAQRRDLRTLPGAFRAFHDDLAAALPPARLVCDPLRTLALGTDASVYRLVPRIVVQVCSAAEVVAVLRAAGRHGVGCTFRAAGTSLSGQAVTDAVLVKLAGAFRGARVLDHGAAIALEPGVVGGDANALLARHGRKLGPDPASIHTAMAGGIAANNAAGMCCGIAQDTYHTVLAMKLVLADGTQLDTADPGSRAAFARSHPEILAGLAALRDEIAADPALASRIREKHRIRNTTGYGLNAFLDFHDPFDVLLHLVVGSEGTLAFIAEITYRTVEEHPHKASALAFYGDLGQACRAVQRLKEAGAAAAAELMDRRSLRAVEGRRGMPPALRTLPDDACALLVEVRAADPAALGWRIAAAAALLAEAPALEPVRFTAVRPEYEALWDVRRDLFPAVGARRPAGTAVLIEDVAFPMRHLAAGMAELQRLFAKHGHREGILFGHALDGNVHLVFTQDFNDRTEVERYRRFMEEVCQAVLGRCDGSLRGELGTGRSMAPFVEREWGAKAYALMRRVKALLDPLGILNPGVLLTGDPEAHLRHLKVLPHAHELVDRCTECGSCEPRCPSSGLTLSPRQRIRVQREIARLRETREDPALLARLEDGYRRQGLDTCATDGLCALSCPVAIDTGRLTRALRAERRGPAAVRVAGAVGDHLAAALGAARLAFVLPATAGAAVGHARVAALASALHRVSGGRLPVWNRHVPRPPRPAQLHDRVRGRPERAVYFPSCPTRIWGPSAAADGERSTSAALLSVLDKAGYDVLFPERVGGLCCGLCFDTKGFPALADRKLRELEAALLARSDGGALPVICDTSPCLKRMRERLDRRLRLLDPAELIRDRLMDRLAFERRAGKVALHVSCASRALGLEGPLREVAEACARTVVLAPPGCCAFSGDLGLTHPELPAAALRDLRRALEGCAEGYSNSRGCEVALSQHGGIPFRSIVHLVDACTSALRAPPDAPEDRPRAPERLSGASAT